ncbi:RES family NAD+ phosphorylase [Aliiruegeria sabulilitoris]|uniref:RES family NAD+ phosphorylase n=1 Tax=Aliiruegeria sabulilitoris TaxID=1510458 RepID=UPI00082EE8A4|nr:RES family NAD+ phosphorylase [Aliiruegeria sabulilitoris]NDR56317.1 RES domain-containing protein [Pseudoruegeria sp. M32A2M]
MIEGQYRPSTARIVDTNEEQRILEEILEDTKPPVPEPCRHLDWPFRSPFRYGCYPGPSRFRRAGRTPGVFYSSEHSITALIETTWGRVQTLLASPGTPWPRAAIEHTAICADINVEKSIDLMMQPLASQGNWLDPADYFECLDIADMAHTEGVEAIRYQSVRDPQGRANVAVLTCGAFAQPAPVRQETWKVLMSPSLIRAYCETLRQDHQYAVGEQALELA